MHEQPFQEYQKAACRHLAEVGLAVVESDAVVRNMAAAARSCEPEAGSGTAAALAVALVIQYR